MVHVEISGESDPNGTSKVVDAAVNRHEDLIHKTTGWIPGEVGKRNMAIESEFQNASYMYVPRTMLWYAIVNISESERQKYLNARIV